MVEHKISLRTRQIDRRSSIWLFSDDSSFVKLCDRRCTSCKWDVFFSSKSKSNVVIGRSHVLSFARQTSIRWASYDYEVERRKIEKKFFLLIMKMTEEKKANKEKNRSINIDAQGSIHHCAGKRKVTRRYTTLTDVKASFPIRLYPGDTPSRS